MSTPKLSLKHGRRKARAARRQGYRPPLTDWEHEGAAELFESWNSQLWETFRHRMREYDSLSAADREYVRSDPVNATVRQQHLMRTRAAKRDEDGLTEYERAKRQHYRNCGFKF
jgi:hypothetical protein